MRGQDKPDPAVRLATRAGKGSPIWSACDYLLCLPEKWFSLCHLINLFFDEACLMKNGWILALSMLGVFMDLDSVKVHQCGQEELSAGYLTAKLLAFGMCGYGAIM